MRNLAYRRSLRLQVPPPVLYPARVLLPPGQPGLPLPSQPEPPPLRNNFCSAKDLAACGRPFRCALTSVAQPPWAVLVSSFVMLSEGCTATRVEESLC